MLKIFLWGTGHIAEEIWRECQPLVKFEILGFIDNDEKKQGMLFKGVHIYSAEILNKYKPDHIVVLTDAYEDIYRQIVNIHPELENIIEDKNFFYKESLLKRYKGTTIPEELEMVEYIKKNGLQVFNYEFTKKYQEMKVEPHYDTENGMYYVNHYGKRLYFSKDLNSEESVTRYYRGILLEQDIRSPHKYLAEDFDVNEGDVVVDAGAAEGNFALEVIDKVSKIYLIEADKSWIDALKVTFKNYLNKVVIIPKFVSSYDDGNLVTLDSLIHEAVNFIKMDIEGNEWDGLQGAKVLIEKSLNLKCAICTYHSDFDQTLIEDFMDKNNLHHTTTPGYIWFPWKIRQNYVSTKLNRAIVRGEKRNG